MLWTIQKITLSYEPEQDRMRLDALDPQGRTLQLWLTQRLANRLIPSLTGLLLKPAADEWPGEALVRQAWEQSLALAQLQPSEPVPLTQRSEGFLVHSIDVQHSPEGIGLVLRWHSDGAARLALTPTELRQWLGILHGRYQQAQWPVAAWPAGFSEGPAPMPALALH